jgi:hypothetical protein
MTRSVSDRAIRATARLAVTSAVKSGKMTRDPCERCGSLKVEGHHPDYSKPLLVRWLCRKHHREVHVESGMPIGRQPRSLTPGKPITVRAAPAERERWERAAATEGCATLSAWIVRVLNRRAIARARAEKTK